MREKIDLYQEMLNFFQDPNEAFPSRNIIQERTSCSSKHKKSFFSPNLAIVAFLDPVLDLDFQMRNLIRMKTIENLSTNNGKI